MASIQNMAYVQVNSSKLPSVESSRPQFMHIRGNASGETTTAANTANVTIGQITSSQTLISSHYAVGYRGNFSESESQNESFVKLILTGDSTAATDFTVQMDIVNEEGASIFDTPVVGFGPASVTDLYTTVLNSTGTVAAYGFFLPKTGAQFSQADIKSQNLFFNLAVTFAGDASFSIDYFVNYIWS